MPSVTPQHPVPLSLNMSTIFNGDSQMEVITVLANCGTDISRARQALTTYIARKQDKGRSTEHILLKLRKLELKFIDDVSLHPAFRDARAFTCLPRSPDLPLPEFVQRRDRRDGLISRSELTITTNPTPVLPTSRSCSQLMNPSSPVDSIDSSVMEDDTFPDPLGSRGLYGMFPRPPSVPPVGTSKSAARSPYMHHPSTSNRHRAFTLPPTMPSPILMTSSTKRLRSSYGSPPPTQPLPDVPTDATDEYDTHTSSSSRLSPQDRNRHISWSSQSSSSSHSSYPGPRTPGNAQLPYPAFAPKPAASPRGDDYPPHRESSTTGRPPVVAELSETDIPSMLFDRESHRSSESDLPAPYNDSPILGERPVSRSFSYPLDNALTGCGAPLVVRREVSRCIQQERGYERPNWPAVLRECGIAEKDIPSLLREMAREAGFPFSRE